MKIKDSFHPYAMITILFWSLAYVLTRLALQYFTAFSLGFLRYFFASCTLVIVAILAKIKLPRKDDLLWFLSSGAVGFFLYMIVFNQGLKSVTAATSSVVIATVPVITALLARFFYKEELRALQWAAIFIEFTGVIILTMMNSTLCMNTGLCWLILAALLLSTYNLLQHKLTKTYTALQTCAFSIFFGTALLFVFLPNAYKEITCAPRILLFYVIVLGVFSSGVAYLSWAKAFAKAKQSSQVSNYMFITPFLTSILGFLLAKEVPDQKTLIGGAIILSGVFIFNFGEKIYQFACKNKSRTRI